MNYCNKEIECMPREELKKLQFEKLSEMLNRIYNNVPFYRKKFDEIVGNKYRDGYICISSES